MESQLPTLYSSIHPRDQRKNPLASHESWTRSSLHQHHSIIITASVSRLYSSTACSLRRNRVPSTRRETALVKSKNGDVGLMEAAEEEPEETAVSKKIEGTVSGAVALIVGTSIGSGILALPKKASPAGLVPSSITMIICWAFLVIEALLLTEVNVNLMTSRRMNRKESVGELDVISIRTMAQETLGEWGGTFATLTYVFLGYTSMIAYCSKSGEILFHLTNLPEPLLNFLFTLGFALLISAGGTAATDRVNQWLTTSMIGLLLAIEVLVMVLGGLPGFGDAGNWGEVPSTVPVMIFSLVYHDIMPVICALLGGDRDRIRSSVLIGSAIPLFALLVWDAITLGLSSHDSDTVSDPVDLLLRVRWDGVPLMVEAFSLLAVGTSMIGTLLGFSEFFKEQLKILFMLEPSSKCTSEQAVELSGIKNWWGRKKIGLMSIAAVVAPSLLVSITVPDAFSAATDIAGGYCMTMLYGVLPPAMAWAMQNKQQDEASSSSRHALIGVGLFACGIVIEQIVQDLFITTP